MTQETLGSERAERAISRRTLAKGAAWSLPAIALATAAPAYAASLRKDPGINGWVLNSAEPRMGNCRWRLTVNSDPSPAPSTPDGAPFGLYLYDIEPGDIITDAKITYWIIGDQEATWTNQSGHGSNWSGPVRGTPQTKADGILYTPYVWTYTQSPIPPTVSPDGRVWLQHFHVRASFTQPNNRCNNVTYWTQRHITVNDEVLTFERRNGTLGPYSSTAGRMGVQNTDVDSAPIADDVLVELPS